MLHTSVRILLGIAIVGGACAMTTSPTVPAQVRMGMWGGDHLRLDVTATGAQAEFDCAHASISEPLTLDAQNHFTVAAQFVTEGGPSSDRPATPRPARFAGSV